jgi:hypothetical protein
VTRAEHVRWCKERALEYLPGDCASAVASMISDMGKHEEVRLDPLLAMIGLMDAQRGPDAARRWIEGFAE